MGGAAGVRHVCEIPFGHLVMVEGLKDIEQGRKEEESTLEAAGGGGRPFGPCGLCVALRTRQDNEPRKNPVKHSRKSLPCMLTARKSLFRGLSRIVSVQRYSRWQGTRARLSAAQLAMRIVLAPSA